ncbi:MAG: radical SAM protein, partial [Desulfocucumaceae bacterium]
MSRAVGLLDGAAQGRRLSLEEGVEVFRECDLLQIGRAADSVRRRIHPENTITFIIDRNINYTNICSSKCKFCAFYREAGHPEAYVMAREDLFKKIEETLEVGGTAVMIQGGMNP